MQVKSKDFVDRARVPPTVVQIVVMFLCCVYSWQDIYRVVALILLLYKHC